MLMEKAMCGPLPFIRSLDEDPRFVRAPRTGVRETCLSKHFTIR
jgi:hypothetical protein